MRVSVNRDDPGYAAWQEAERKNEIVKIMLDGEEVQLCVTADDVEGMVLCFEADDNHDLKMTLDGADIATVVRRGKVEITFVPREAKK